MAIDTREKRQSVIAISFYPMGPSVTPNAAQDQEWRQQAGYGYSGVAAAAPQAGQPFYLRDNYTMPAFLGLGVS